MDRTVQAKIAASPRRVRTIVEDLATYPQWLELVTEARTDAADDGDAGPAWSITLQAKIGPFARSKRLRMVRTPAKGDPGIEPPVVFERRELDGRDHSTWVMTVSVLADDIDENACEVDIDLAYGGSLWSGALEAVLGAVVGSAGLRLSAYASEKQD